MFCIYFSISHSNATSILAKVPPNTVKTKLFDIHGQFGEKNDNSILSVTIYVSNADSTLNAAQNFIILILRIYFFFNWHPTMKKLRKDEVH